MSKAHTNGHKKFLFIVLYEDNDFIDIIRSGHEPTPEEINEVVGADDPPVVFDPDTDSVIRFDEDGIIDLPAKEHA